MKIYAKHFFSSLAISLLLFLILPIIDSPNEIVVLIVMGTFFYCTLIQYPIIILAVLIFLLKKIDVNLNPYVVSFSLIIFTLSVSLVVYVPALTSITGINNGSTWQLWLIALMSSVSSILFIYRKKKDKK